MPKQYPFNDLYLEKGGIPANENTIKHYTFEAADWAIVLIKLWFGILCILVNFPEDLDNGWYWRIHYSGVIKIKYCYIPVIVIIFEVWSPFSLCVMKGTWLQMRCRVVCTIYFSPRIWLPWEIYVIFSIVGDTLDIINTPQFWIFAQIWVKILLNCILVHLVMPIPVCFLTCIQVFTDDNDR